MRTPGYARDSRDTYAFFGAIAPKVVTHGSLHLTVYSGSVYYPVIVATIRSRLHTTQNRGDRRKALLKNSLYQRADT